MRKFVFEIPGLFPDFVVCLIAVKTAGPSSDMPGLRRGLCACQSVAKRGVGPLFAGPSGPGHWSF